MELSLCLLALVGLLAKSISLPLVIASCFGCNPKFSSWKSEGEGSNCCLWDGVECDENTGHVVALDLSSSCLYGSIDSHSSLFLLSHLRRLDLADNHFNYSRIPTALRQFSRLTYLNLSMSRFFGQVPSEISHLSELSCLDLGFNYDGEKFLELKNPNFGSLIQNLTSLEKLDLSLVNMPSTIPDLLANFSSLVSLLLQDCGLYGEFPANIFLLPNLEDLNVEFNEFLTGHFPEFNHSHLSVVELGGTSFSGNIPSSVENLVSLSRLDVSDCSFSGHIPSSLGKLSHLSALDLGNNNFNGHIPYSLQNLTQLTSFSLYANKVTGPIPSWLGNLTQLVYIYLHQNELDGLVPQSLSRLRNLEGLSLQHNNLVGTLIFDMFLNMKSLAYLELGNNKFSLLFGKKNVNATVSKFKLLGLSSCNISSEFPNFLEHQNQLEWLDLASNGIHGLIPQWMWHTSIKTLKAVDISNNSLTGFQVQPSAVLPWIYLRILDLSFNMLQGKLPLPPQSISYYDVSNNRLNGEIRVEICNFSSLLVLDLASNNFSGKIPQCSSGNFGNPLLVLNLRNNSFDGSIPQTCTKTSNLRMLDVSHNKFQGKLPRSLATCMMLEHLDVADNHIIDIFPTWLGTLPELKHLILKNNGFYGPIGKPRNTFEFSKLRVIDLSYNGFTMELPSEYIFIWESMKDINVSDPAYTNVNIFVELAEMYLNISIKYYYSTTIVHKRVETVYPKIQEAFAAVDLSSNKFTGGIPNVIGNLKGLRSLNLSNNKLIGHIPSSLMNISNLESLDLSYNQLFGEISHQLTQLTFLQIFDVAHNRLTGPIPQGNQFNTFGSASFEDNLGLCGNPLPKKCDNSDPSPPLSSSASEKDHDDGSWYSIEYDWKFVLVGFISGLFVGVALGDIVNTRRLHGWLLWTFGKMVLPRRKDQRERSAIIDNSITKFFTERRKQRMKTAVCLPLTYTSLGNEAARNRNRDRPGISASSVAAEIVLPREMSLGHQKLALGSV
ncbi:LRR domain containing protein [Parasponia andersonii]|uniref:LRR domain containing protein n=1 Tax=Parasponia andersonii TaxID=3476 RepID=A0A2P5BD83_PARAD|nr:LRR domain containing protein [Parasponia andersonii]